MNPRPCITPTCRRMAVGGRRGARCATCQRAHDHTRNTHPSRAAYRDPRYRAAVKWGVCQIQIPGVCTYVATTRDHIVPISKGGTNDPSNLRPACRECNSSKRDHLA